MPQFKMRRPPTKPKETAHYLRNEVVFFKGLRTLKDLRERLASIPDAAVIHAEAEAYDHYGEATVGDISLAIHWKDTDTINSAFDAAMKVYEDKVREYNKWRELNAAEIKKHEQAKEQKKVAERKRKAQLRKQTLEKTLTSYEKAIAEQTKELAKVTKLLETEGGK